MDGAAATGARRTQETLQVYTDGGVDMGQRCWTAQATWGLYLKDGDPAAVEEALRGAAHTEQKAEGCVAYGQAMGPALSSTRAEAIGIYAALAIPGPLHIKLDNAGVVKRGNKLLAGRPGRRPWGMQEDGDIWQSIAANVQQRTTPIRLTKVKGHAKLEDVMAGTTTAGDREGNRISDEVATEAKTKQRAHQMRIL